MIKAPLTYEDVVNSYEYKVMSRLLKNEYPWIEKFDIDSKSINEYNLIFLNVKIDYKLFMETYDVELKPYPKIVLEQGDVYDAPFLNLIFTFDDRDIAPGIKFNIEKLANSVKKSPALPKELKLPESRHFAIGTFYI